MNTVTMPSITAGTYVVDATTSSVRFSVKHLFGLGTVRGTFAIRRAEVRIGAELPRCSVDAVLDAASFHTGNPRRDKDIRSARFLDVANHPELTFRGTGLQMKADGTATISGELVVKGQATPVALAVSEYVATGNGFRCVAECVIDRYATAVRGGKGLVGRELAVRIEVCATAR